MNKKPNVIRQEKYCKRKLEKEKKMSNLIDELQVKIAKQNESIITLLSNEWVTFPCNGKIPMIKKWTEITEKIPHSMFGCNYGILCGKINGIVVIDCDLLKTEIQAERYVCGVKAWMNFETQFPELILAPKVRTQSGGLHIYFAYDERLISSIQQLHTDDNKKIKIDIMSDGKFVVGPGSQGYTFIDKSYTYPLTHLPDRMIKILTTTIKNTTEKKNKNNNENAKKDIVSKKELKALVN